MSEEREQSSDLRGSRISWREVPWIVVLGMSLSLHLWFPRIDTEPLNDTYSAEVGGRNAFFQLAEHRFPGIERNLEPLYRAVDRIDTGSTLCLLGPARYPTEREWQSVLGWVEDGGSLLFAARWDDAEVAIPKLGVRIETLAKVGKTDKSDSEKMAAEKSSDDARAEDSGGKEPRPGLSSPTEAKPAAEASPADGTTANAEAKPDLESASGSGEASSRPVTPIETNLAAPDRMRWESRGAIVLDPGWNQSALVRNIKGLQAVRLHYGSGAIVLCASDQVFSNSSLFDRKYDNGVLAMRLLEEAGKSRPVVFDESLNASGTPQVVGLLLDPHLRPLTIQVLIVLVVFGWRGGRRFGGLLPKGTAARHNLTDHTDALGNLYYKTRNGAGAVRTYLEQLKREMRLHLTASADLRALAPVALRTGIPAEEIRSLLSRAEVLAKNESTRRREAGEMIRSLARLRRKS